MKNSLVVIAFCLTTQLLCGQNIIRSTKSTPFVLGTIEEIESKILAEKRVLNIYLPSGYNKNDTVKYPVIYLLDGSADEDFIHIAGLVVSAIRKFSLGKYVAKLNRSGHC